MVSDRFKIPVGRNTYCGPVVLAYVMRSGVDAATLQLESVIGTTQIRYVAGNELDKAMTLANVKHEPAKPQLALDRRITLHHWIQRGDPNEYVISVADHLLVVHGEYWYDNTCLAGLPLSKLPEQYRRKPVTRAWRIIR